MFIGGSVYLQAVGVYRDGLTSSEYIFFPFVSALLLFAVCWSEYGVQGFSSYIEFAVYSSIYVIAKTPQSMKISYKKV